MRFSWAVIYFLIWVYRCVFAVIAQVVVSRLTQLGDSDHYQKASITIFDELSGLSGFVLLNTSRIVSTSLTQSLGGFFHLIFGGVPVMINIGFQTVGFIGIVAIMRAVEPDIRLKLFLPIVLLPSFTIWSSIAGKEAIVVFAVGIVCAWVLKAYRGLQPRFGFLEWGCVVLIAMFKDNYMPGMLFLLVGTYVAARVRQRAFMVIAAGLLSIVPTILLVDWLNGQLEFISASFLDGGGSTRALFWVERYDVLTKAPLGMFLSFFGPTLSEIQLGPLQAMSFFESAILLGLLIFHVLVRFLRVPVYLAAMVFFSLGWLLFGTYPFGAMNPGSAVRYRTGYELFILTGVALMARDRYLTWLTSHENRREKNAHKLSDHGKQSAPTPSASEVQAYSIS